MLWRLARAINVAGAWKWDNVLVSGVPLLACWLIESAAMLLAGVFIPMKAIPADDPECRQCGGACKLVRPIARFAAGRQAELVGAVEGYDFGAVLGLPPPASDREPQLSLRLVACPKCGQTNLVTVNFIGWKIQAGGQSKLEIKPVVNQLIVPPAEANALKGILKEVMERRESPATEDARPAESAQPSSGEPDVPQDDSGNEGVQ